MDGQMPHPWVIFLPFNKIVSKQYAISNRSNSVDLRRRNNVALYQLKVDMDVLNSMKIYWALHGV